MQTGIDNINIDEQRLAFPVLHQQINGYPLVYLDNAATTQKPKAVTEAVNQYYNQTNSNVHRGLHHLSDEATRLFEQAREKVKDFLGASSREEIIFTRGTTEGINLVAAVLGQGHIKHGNEILISGMEHHSNIVPWQMLCQRTGATLQVIPVTNSGELDLQAMDTLLTPKTALVAVNHVSNMLGTINPVKQIIAKAKTVGALTLIDGAQAASHLPINVTDLGADFYAFSAHKIFGPTGIGALYGRQALLDQLPPWQGGGEMIAEVRFEGTTYAELPYKFEAGTPNIAGAIGLGAAIDYINQLGKEQIMAQEIKLLHAATEGLLKIPGIEIIGTAPNKVAVTSFVVDGVHHQDIGLMLNTRGVAIRTGHHCTQPLMERFGIAGTSRASFAFYNTLQEVETFLTLLKKTIDKLR